MKVRRYQKSHNICHFVMVTRFPLPAAPAHFPLRLPEQVSYPCLK